MDANGIAEAVHAVVPNMLHQLLLTYRPPLMHHQVKSAFESLHLWLVVCDDECALLLLKKDLRAGNADSFLSDIISKMNTGTDASG